MRNDAIQALRGIAALLVVITHSILTLTEKGGTASAASNSMAWAVGEAGVKMFFLISGFIMLSTMYTQFGVPGAASGFIRRRIIRIVPLYWIATLLYALRLTVSAEPPELNDLARSLAFFPYMNGHGEMKPVYGLGWTLNYEMFFYATFAVALLQSRRAGLVSLFLFYPLLVGSGYLHLVSCHNSVCQAVWFWDSGIILYFASGMLLALLRIQLQRRRMLPPIRTADALIISLALVGIYGVCLGGASAAAATMVQMPICVAAAAVCALASDGPQPQPGGIREVPLMLGDASYSIYLTHSFLVGPAGRLWAAFFGSSGLVIFTIFMLIGAGILGVVTYHFVEKPILQILKQRLLRPRTAAT